MLALLNPNLTNDDLLALMRLKREGVEEIGNTIRRCMDELPTPEQRLDYAMQVLPIFLMYALT